MRAPILLIPVWIKKNTSLAILISSAFAYDKTETVSHTRLPYKSFAERLETRGRQLKGSGVSRAYQLADEEVRHSF